MPLEFSNDSLGFHHTFTCGNDVIEGGIPAVPEADTFILMSLGLRGIAALRRRKKASELRA